MSRRPLFSSSIVNHWYAIRKVYTLCANVTFTTPDLTFQTYVSTSIRGKDVSPEMPINRGMEVKGEGGDP